MERKKGMLCNEMEIRSWSQNVMSFGVLFCWSLLFFFLLFCYVYFLFHSHSSHFLVGYLMRDKRRFCVHVSVLMCYVNAIQLNSFGRLLLWNIIILQHGNSITGGQRRRTVCRHARIHNTTGKRMREGKRWMCRWRPDYSGKPLKSQTDDIAENIASRTNTI